MKYIHLSHQLSILLVLISSIMFTSCSQQSVKENTKTTISPDIKKQTLSKLNRNKYKSGITALNNNELKKAQRIFYNFIKTNPSIAGAYSNLAIIHYKKNEFNKSFKLINKALKLNPEQSQALNLRAQLYIKNGDIHLAKADYLLALKLKPNYINAQYNLALLYDIYLQEIELAIKHYKAYMSLLNKPDETTKEWVNHLEGTLKDA